MLYSDDMLLRHVAGSDDWFGKYFKGTEFNFDGVWTQTVLMHCLKNGFLDKDSYSKMIVKLVCSHYYFTSIDADVLIEAARQSNWIPSEPFKTVSEMLKKTHDENSTINISIDFFFKLWKQQIPPELRDYLVFNLLSVVADRKNQKEILDRLVFQMRNRFSVFPLVEKVALLADLLKKMSE